MLIIDQLKKSDRELRWIAFVILAGLGLLLAGLWFLQIVSARRYRAMSQNQSFRTVRVPAIRGKILDRNRRPLADNRPSYNVNVYLEELRADFRHEYTNGVRKEFTNAHPKVKLTPKVEDELMAQARYRVASNLLFAVSCTIQEPRLLLENAFERHYEQRRSLPLPLLNDISFVQVAQFVEKSPPQSALALEVQPLRVYPHKSLAAHLLGHLRREDNPPEGEEISFRFWMPDFSGAAGLESAFDEHLRGKAGVKLVVVNSALYRHSEEMLTEPEAGHNLVLTLDLDIQQAAENALRAAGSPTRGAVVVMDPQNGDILAMSSSPTFDPNDFAPRLSPEKWASLNDTNLFPMFNRAAYGKYPPGSVFKIVTGLACLEAGFDPEEIYESKGYFQLRPRGRIWQDLAPPGRYNFRKAFARSSNFYFQTNGVRVGPQRIIEMGNQFKLGEPAGLTQGLEAKGYFPKADNVVKADGSPWREGDTANLAIGQGEVAVTPLQMAVMTAAIANGGKILKPRIVLQIEPQEKESEQGIIRIPAGEVRSELNVKAEHLALLQQAMVDDIEFRDPDTGHLAGTGRSAAVRGFRIGGKTGTAQRTENGRLKGHATWFVSFGPVEEPRFVVVAVVEVEGGGSGATTCCPIARSIYEAILKRDQAGRGKASSLVSSGIPAGGARFTAAD